MDYAIIAAGRGSRLAKEGVKCPKPLVEINGKTLILRLLEVFKKNGASSVSIIINEETSDVKHYLANLKSHFPLNIVTKTTESSLHSFYHLKPFLNSDRFCLSTVDTVFRESEFSNYIHSFKNDETIDGLFAVTRYIDDESPLYVSTDKNMIINGFYDDKNETDEFVSGGIYCLTQKTFDTLDRCINLGISRMRNFQKMLIEENYRIKAFEFEKIIDIDHKSDIEKATDITDKE